MVPRLNWTPNMWKSPGDGRIFPRFFLMGTGGRSAKSGSRGPLDGTRHCWSNISSPVKNCPSRSTHIMHMPGNAALDRKSAVEGKRVSGGRDLGLCRNIKKKK